jgi:hypothetical protein
MNAEVFLYSGLHAGAAVFHISLSGCFHRSITPELRGYPPQFIAQAPNINIYILK